MSRRVRALPVALASAIVTVDLAATAVVGLVASGCGRMPVRAAHTERPPVSSDVLLATLAERERRMDGLRVSMQVRASGTPSSALLPSPAYLAVDRPERVRLQVLSPFGITVLGLAIEGARYELVMPLRNTHAEGQIDLGATATAADSDRMILALALLFRPKIDRASCVPAAPLAVRCMMPAGVSAEITVDDALRPVREAYLQPDGTPLVVARFTDYAESDSQAMPGTITVEDPAGGATLVARVLRARRVAPADASSPERATPNPPPAESETELRPGVDAE